MPSLRGPSAEPVVMAFRVRHFAASRNDASIRPQTHHAGAARVEGLQGPQPMSSIDTEEIAALIRPGRVHRRVYTDPAIFNLELEKIFGSAWIYVGHESQVKN